MKTLCVTGHRPAALGGYGREIEDRLFVTAIRAIEERQPEQVITGMALGWDQAVARACIQLGLPFIAAIPFAGQESTWPEESQRKYRQLLEKAMHTEYVNPPPYRAFKMADRNRWMVERSLECLCLWNSTPKGGTFDCVQYAMVCGKPIYNAWAIYTDQKQYLDKVEKL